MAVPGGAPVSNQDIGVDFEWEGLDEAFAELEAECTAVVRGLTVEIWNGILAKTPQYYGELAASWSYSLNEPTYVDRSERLSMDLPGAGRVNGRWFTTVPLSQGHYAAIAIAKADSAGRENGFNLGDEVWIANGADHGDGYYADTVEHMGSLLRAANRPGLMVQRTVDRAGSVYAEGMTTPKAKKLDSLSVGGFSAARD